MSYTTSQLRKACQGKSASDGGLNVPDLRKIAKERSPKTDRIYKMTRPELIKLLCDGSEPRYTLESEVAQSREFEHQRRQQRERYQEGRRAKPIKAATLSYRSEKPVPKEQEEEMSPEVVVDDFRTKLEKQWLELARYRYIKENPPKSNEKIERSHLNIFLGALEKAYAKRPDYLNLVRDQFEKKYLQYQRAVKQLEQKKKAKQEAKQKKEQRKGKRRKEREEIFEDHPEINEFLVILENFNEDHTINNEGKVFTKDGTEPIDKKEANELLKEGVSGTIRFYTDVGAEEDEGPDESGTDKIFLFKITNPTLKTFYQNLFNEKTMEKLGRYVYLERWTAYFNEQTGEVGILLEFGS